MKYYPFVMLALMLVLSSCNSRNGDLEDMDFELRTDIETAQNVEVLYSDSAIVRMKIQAPTMIYHLDNIKPYQEFTDGVRVDFYDINGKISSTLTSKRAFQYEQKNMVVVQDSVVWQSVTQEKIETEELIWEERLKKIYTQKFARITRPEEIVYGYGFETDQDFKNARIKAVTGRIKIDDLEQSPSAKGNTPE